MQPGLHLALKYLDTTAVIYIHLGTDSHAPRAPRRKGGGGESPLVVAFTRSVGLAEKGGLVAPTTSLTRN